MKLYLTGPSAGYFDDNRAAFEAAALKLRERRLVVTSRADLDDAAGEIKTELCVALSHDGVVLLPGWRASESATLIVTVALRVGMPVFEFPNLTRLDAAKSDGT
jgi:hypothetical protein